MQLTVFFQRHALPLILGITGTAIVLNAPAMVPNAGPGYWPRAVGFALVLCALCQPSPPQAKPSAKEKYHQAGGLLLAGLLWIILIPLAGWLPATICSAFLSCKAAGCRIQETLLLTALLCMGLWLGVEHLLNTPLPQGIITGWSTTGE